ncbi:hypothetical protein HNO88_000423 [Novosphingobium chloroacetimidivorans]|uniref:Uncharacterized protein n=1 Tax=Novosphingobium chloroacetimidivorans TaxID=1428314 RepID=A0A7W7K6K7_9SPHN|nr:hypothetical protein [Novosphingobium chloroacetimidivorans]MBB4857126.1 hypothetical protein [Novosphingobium chloroacetimidivorans]
MTAGLEAKVLADKALRDTTKLTLDKRLAQVKLDLEARGVAGRVADEFVEHAKMVYDEGAAVAQEHPGIIGGTIAALMLWILRNPIIAWLDALLGPRR